MSTLGCMRTHLTRMVFVGVLGIVLASAALMMPQTSWADETKVEAETPESPVPNATYDESQPGANDPRVKEGFAAYKAGDFKQAYDIWLPLAEAGNAEAQFRVGRLYDFGEGVQPDIELTIYWYQRSSTKMHLSGIYNLAFTLFWEDQYRDRNKGLQLFKRAAVLGHIKAQQQYGIALAIMSENQDYSMAFKWLYISWVNGNESAIKPIEKLTIQSNNISRANGIKMMREWFQTHPRISNN